MSEAASSFAFSVRVLKGTFLELTIPDEVRVVRLSADSALPAEGARNGRNFSNFPKSAQTRAMHRRQALLVYFGTLKREGKRKEAELLARAEWLCLRHQSCDARTIRRWAKIVEKAGGIAAAPMATYLDLKSCDHPGARRAARKAQS